MSILSEREQLARAAATMRRHVAVAARNDPSTFCEFVLRDERNGRPIKQARAHEQWHRLISDYPRLVLWSHVEAGKTQQVSVGRTLWELGNNPNLRVAIVSKTADLAKKIILACKKYIDPSDRRPGPLQEVFPGLRRADDTTLPWNQRQITVERNGVIAKDPSIQACGNYGNIHGARIDLLIFDDVIDSENTRTATPRQHLLDWIHSASVFGRLTEDARVIFLTNAWHPDDAAHKLVKEPRFQGFKFPVQDDQGEPTWPERWSRKRIQQAREDMDVVEFSRALMCMARADETARFRKEYIDRCTALGLGQRLCEHIGEVWERCALDLGIAPEDALAAHSAYMLGKPPPPPGGMRIYTGVDLAVQKHDAADKTVFFTIGVYPDGRRRVLNVRSGRWSSPEIIAELKDVWKRFGSVFVVENNGAQQYIIDMVGHDTAIPIWPFTTGQQKAHPEFGVESLAAEFHAGKWIIPSGKDGSQRGKEVDEWAGELVNYDPTAHTGDRLMASWFAREGARMGERDEGTVGVGVTVLGGDDDN